MHFLFLTRCYKTTNLQTIKDDIKAVFDNSEHTYELALLVDLSHGQNEDQFKAFEDDKTTVHFVHHKKDTYMYEDSDDYLATVDKDEDNTYVYFLDDDNTIKSDLLHVFDTSDNVDMIIFKLEGRAWGNKGCTIGNVDIGNYITKLKVIKKVKIGYSDSHVADGHFVETIRKNKYSIVYIDKSLGYYNKLPRP